jgi:hypothetical protein
MLSFRWRLLTKQVLRADGYGKNAAIECPACLRYPVLLIALPGMRGTSSDKPVGCRHCGAKIYITDDVTTDQLHILNLVVENNPR